MYASGVDHGVIAGMLDWLDKEALQPNGDFYFPTEAPEYKDLQRVYRPMTFGKGGRLDRPPRSSASRWCWIGSCNTGTNRPAVASTTSATIRRRSKRKRRSARSTRRSSAI